MPVPSILRPILRVCRLQALEHVHARQTRRATLRWASNFKSAARVRGGDGRTKGAGRVASTELLFARGSKVGNRFCETFWNALRKLGAVMGIKRVAEHGRERKGAAVAEYADSIQ